jgi:hypothetical protein
MGMDDGHQQIELSSMGIQKWTVRGLISMGLPSSIDCFPPAALGMLTSTPSDDLGVGLVDLGGLLDLFSASVFLLGGGLSVSCRTFLGFPLFCVSYLKLGGTLSCSWGRLNSPP